MNTITVSKSFALGRWNTMRTSAWPSVKSFKAGKTIQVDLWLAEESDFEGDPRPRRTWTKMGKVHHSSYLGEHICYNVLGAVRPKDGRLGDVLFNLCDSVIFQVFLN